MVIHVLQYGRNDLLKMIKKYLKYRWWILVILINICYSSDIHHTNKNHFVSRFEVGGGIGYLMPRTKFSNTNTFSMTGLWKMSPTYGLRVTLLKSKLFYETGDASITFIQASPGIEISLKSTEKVIGYTLLDIGFSSDEKDALFIFGIGMNYKINKDYSMKLELRDHHIGIGIPFMTFPNSQAGIRGEGGSKYLDLQLRLHYSL